MLSDKQKKKILIITPKFPYPVTGACEQDRYFGIKMFLELGYEIRVITKVSPGKEDSVLPVSEKLGIKIFAISYKCSKHLSFKNRFLKNIKRIINPLFWDGAAFEYSDPEIKNMLKEQISFFKPDYIYFDYTYLWPLYKIARKSRVPIITRSINFEPVHFLEEDGYSFLNMLKFLFKLISEILTARRSDFLFSITPKEEKIYKHLGVKNIANLPLRGLCKYIGKGPKILPKEKLNVFFTGSTYNVSHNRAALEFFVKKIAPEAERQMPGKFIFNITGAKMPNEMMRFFSDNIIYHGYVDDMDQFVKNMDIALVPSLFGSGMQQKIFEPISRGIPTITSPRGIVGYPFENKKHVILANTTDDFLKALDEMRDYDLRKKIADEGIKMSKDIFSENKIKSIILNSINYVSR